MIRGRQQGSSFHTHLKDLVIPLGSVLVPAITLLAASGWIPMWATLVIALYLIFVMLGLIVPIVYRLGSRWLVGFRGRRKMKRLAQTFYPRLLHCADELFRLIDDQRADNFPGFLHSLSSWPEAREQPIEYFMNHFASLKVWLQLIKKHLGFHEPKRFGSYTGDLGELIAEYNRLCVRIHRQIEQFITTRGWDTNRLNHLKQEWEIRREGHAQFMRTWKELKVEINRAAGVEICSESYYEPLKNLP